jgi:hypothetical protein
MNQQISIHRNPDGSTIDRSRFSDRHVGMVIGALSPQGRPPEVRLLNGNGRMGLTWQQSSFRYMGGRGVPGRMVRGVDIIKDSSGHVVDIRSRGTHEYTGGFLPIGKTPAFYSPRYIFG